MKKKAAKFCALALAAGMVVTSSVTALAASTITLSGIQGDRTYKTASTITFTSEGSASFNTLTLVDNSGASNWDATYSFDGGTFTMNALSASEARITLWNDTVFNVAGDAVAGEFNTGSHQSDETVTVAISGSLTQTGKMIEMIGSQLRCLSSVSDADVSIGGDFILDGAEVDELQMFDAALTIGGDLILNGTSNGIWLYNTSKVTVRGDVVMSDSSAIVLKGESSMIVYGDLNVENWNNVGIAIEDNASLIIYGDAYSDGTELTEEDVTLYENGTFLVYHHEKDSEIPSEESFEVSVASVDTASVSVNTEESVEEEESIEEESVDEDTSTEDFIAAVNTIEAEIEAAQPTSGTVTIPADYEMTSLPNSIMQALVENSNVTLVFEFTYNDRAYTITIPAGAAVDNEIAWYGPLYLIGMYGSGSTATTSTVKTTVSSGSTYTVQSGDTLSLIAADHDMTLSELAALNPQITDLNTIYVGDIVTIG